MLYKTAPQHLRQKKRSKRKLDTEEDRQTGTMSSVSVSNSSVSQDGLSDLGSEHRNAKVKRPVRISSVVTHEVSGPLLHFKIGIGKMKYNYKSYV